MLLCFGSICHLAANVRLSRCEFLPTLSRILHCPNQVKRRGNSSDEESNFKKLAIQDMALEILQYFPPVEPYNLVGAEHRLLRRRHPAGLRSSKTLLSLQQQRIAKLTGEAGRKVADRQTRNIFDTVNTEYEKLMLNLQK